MGAAVLCAVPVAGAAPQRADAVVLLDDESCTTDTAAWKPSANAAISSQLEGGRPTCELRPLEAAGTKNISLTSSGSRTVAAGSAVHVAGQVRSSQRGAVVQLQLQEVDATGAVVRKFTTQRTSRSFGWVGAKLTTKRPGSRVRVVVTGLGMTGVHLVRLKNVRVTMTPSSPANGPTPPSAAVRRPPPPKSSAAVPTPTSSATTPPSRSSSTTPPPSALRRPSVPCSAVGARDAETGPLVFGDEFSGSSVNTSKWRVRDNESLSFDKARIRSDNVTVHDGVLDIAGKRQSAGGRDWTTGYLDTIGKFSQKYGRWEMRAKVPTDETRTRGIWPAFWLRGDRTNGEIDIMETYGSPATKSYNPSTSYEWTVWKDTTQNTGSDRFHGWGHPQGHGQPIYRDFHTYAVDWSPECMAFSFDGRVVGVVKTDQASWLTGSFDSPFNIRLNMQIGSPYWGNPDDANTKPLVNYLIDYVRVYAPPD